MSFSAKTEDELVVLMVPAAAHASGELFPANGGPGRVVVG
jgi:hypothetical protein